MSTITSSSAKEQVYNGILRAENGWISGSPSGGDIGTLSEPEVQYTPLILDLNGDGVQTISFSEGVKFDLDGDGDRELTGWVDENDGLLALDLNENGKIDNGTERFGDATIVDGKVPGDAFRALRLYDENNDGIINKSDAIFEKLLVWVDSNSNGKSSKNELLSLSDLGIVSISLKSYLDVEFQNGNVLVKRGSFNYDNGSAASMDDVHFYSIDGSNELKISLLGIPSSSELTF